MCRISPEDTFCLAVLPHPEVAYVIGLGGMFFTYWVWKIWLRKTLCKKCKRCQPTPKKEYEFSVHSDFYAICSFKTLKEEIYFLQA